MQTNQSQFDLSKATHKSFVYLGIELSLNNNKEDKIFKFIILQNEFWAPVSAWRYVYKISSLGRVKRISRLIVIANKITRITEKFLSIRPDRKGYRVVSLSNAKKTVNRTIHRLVAIAFVNNPNILSLKEVNHKNGNKSDNRSVNLEWSDRCRNIQHGYNKGLFKIMLGDKSYHHKLTEVEVKDIKRSKQNNPALTLKYFAGKYKVDQSTISAIFRNKTWKHIII